MPYQPGLNLIENLWHHLSSHHWSHRDDDEVIARDSIGAAGRNDLPRMTSLTIGPTLVCDVQEIADLLSQAGGGEWFLEERRVEIQNAVTHDLVVGVARHVQHFQLGAL